MKRLLKWVALLLLVLLAIPILGVFGIYGYYRHIVNAKPALQVPFSPGELGANVNVFAATGGYFFLCGHDTPAATMPFGMVRLAPDTESIIVDQRGFNRAGYFYGDNKIIGFSHTRLVGGDTLEGNVFRMFPTVESRAAKMRGKDRFARFSHRDEAGFPGYYAVRLRKDDVLAELAATTRVGLHRYTFHKDDAPHLLMDITSAPGDKHCKDGVVMISPESHELEGTVKTFGSFSGRYGGLDVYFVARFNQPFASFATWNGTRVSPNEKSAAGDDIGVDLGFARGTGDQVIEARVAISYVSIANARANLEAEAANQSFEQVVEAAKAAWEKRLALVRVQGGSETQRRIFYTALYHAFQMPTVFTDVNGEYTGFDRKSHKAEGFQYYTDFSLWDTFRTVQPLYNLIARSDERDMMVSLVEMAKTGGCFPRWPSGCGYTGCMLGTPADAAVAEAYLKGIRDFDIEKAYACMRETGLTGKPEWSKFGGRNGLDAYLKYGYCPSDKMTDGVAATLEYSWEDYAISLLAKELGHVEDAATFAEHARSYRNVWNPSTLFFEGKDSLGNFRKERNPYILSYVDFDQNYTREYVEGSGEQWRWGVPFDPEGLISLFPDRETFVRELETYFAKSKPGVGQLPSAYYWQGNEPYFHACYLFNAAGRPDLTQKWARWIMDTKYVDDYVGLDGNDDGGTLSSWYVLSAMGFYPIAGTTKYELGSPLFDSAQMQIDGKTLTITAENNGPRNVYVQRVTLNGAPLEHPWFDHSQIAQGGTLKFEMGATPPGRQ